MSETEVWYVVQCLRHWDSLQVLGLPLNAHQEPGCVGFMPIFDSEEAAKKWRDDHQPTASIAMIMQAQETTP